MADPQKQFTDDDWAAVLDAVRSNPQTAREVSSRLTPEQAQAFVDYQKRAVKPANPGGDNTAISFSSPNGDVGLGIGDALAGGLIGKAAGPVVGKALSNPLVGGTIAGIEGYRRGGPLQGLEWGLGGALGQKVGGPLISKILDSTLGAGEGAAGESAVARGVSRKSFSSSGGTPPVPSGEGPVGGPSAPRGTQPPSSAPSAPGDAPAVSTPPSRTSSSTGAPSEPGMASSHGPTRDYWNGQEYDTRLRGDAQVAAKVSKGQAMRKWAAQQGGQLPDDSILSPQATAERLSRRPFAGQGFKEGQDQADQLIESALSKVNGKAAPASMIDPVAAEAEALNGPARPTDRLVSQFDSWLRANPGGFKGGRLDTSAEDLASELAGPGKVQPGSLKQMPFPKGSGATEKALRARGNFLDTLQKTYTKDPGLIRDDKLRAILEDMMKSR